MTKEPKFNHELDLNLIEEFGFLDNNEIKLSNREFLTDEKVKVINDIAWTLFGKIDNSITILS